MEPWVDLVSDAREQFGKGVKVTRLCLQSVPGFEMIDLREERATAHLHRETYEHNMPGFGAEYTAPPADLPEGWKRFGDQTA